MSYRTTRQADEDVSDLYAYYLQQFGLVRADAYVDGLFDAFDLLAANPYLARERPELRPPVRLHP